jgi:small subunit ribosomal protein S17e
MGTTRDAKLKSYAKEIVKNHPDEVSTDFEKNKKFLDKTFNIYGNRIRNRLAGYIITWIKTKDNTYEEIRKVDTYDKENKKGKRNKKREGRETNYE